MAEQPPPVSSERVLDIIRQDPVGAYLLRAAIAEATCEAYQRQLAEAGGQASSARHQEPDLRPG